MARTGALPHFIPQHPDPGLEVSAKGGLVTVRSRRSVEDWLTEDWSIRWWVNGKPVVDSVSARHGVRDSQEEAREISEPMEFSFQLDVDPARLGAKPGDVVEFQLLYSSNGLAFAGAHETLKRAMDVTARSLPVRVSNRARWE